MTQDDVLLKKVYGVALRLAQGLTAQTDYGPVEALGLFLLYRCESAGAGLYNPLEMTVQAARPSGAPGEDSLLEWVFYPGTAPEWMARRALEHKPDWFEGEVGT